MYFITFNKRISKFYIKLKYSLDYFFKMEIVAFVSNTNVFYLEIHFILWYGMVGIAVKFATSKGNINSFYTGLKSNLFIVPKLHGNLYETTHSLKPTSVLMLMKSNLHIPVRT